MDFLYQIFKVIVIMFIAIVVIGALYTLIKLYPVFGIIVTLLVIAYIWKWLNSPVEKM